MLSALLNSFGIVPDLLRGKDPKQALTDNLRMGAMVGGAAAMPGLLGGGAAGAAGGASGIMESMGGLSPVQGPGLMDQVFGGMKSAAGYMKPFGEAAQTASQVQGLMGQQQQAPMPPQMPMGRQGADPIGQMMQSQMQLEQQRRGNWQGGMNGGLFEELRRKYGM